MTFLQRLISRDAENVNCLKLDLLLFKTKNQIFPSQKYATRTYGGFLPEFTSAAACDLLTLVKLNSGSSLFGDSMATETAGTELNSTVDKVHKVSGEFKFKYKKNLVSH